MTRFVRAAGEGYEIDVREGVGSFMTDGTGLVMVRDGTAVVNGTLHLHRDVGAWFQGCARVEYDGLIAVARDTRARVFMRTVRRTTKPWGYEDEVENTSGVQLKFLHVDEGGRTSLQYHEHKEETMVTVHDLEPTHVVPRQVHRVEGPADYFEASTYHPGDVVRVEDDYGRTT